MSKKNKEWIIFATLSIPVQVKVQAANLKQAEALADKLLEECSLDYPKGIEPTEVFSYEIDPIED